MEHLFDDDPLSDAFTLHSSILPHLSTMEAPLLTDITMTEKTPSIYEQARFSCRRILRPSVSHTISDDFQSNMSGVYTSRSSSTRQPRHAFTGLGLIFDYSTPLPPDVQVPTPATKQDPSDSPPTLNRQLRLSDICVVDSSPAEFTYADSFQDVATLPIESSGARSSNVTSEPRAEAPVSHSYCFSSSQSDMSFSEDTPIGYNPQLIIDFTTTASSYDNVFDYQSNSSHSLIGLFPDINMFSANLHNQEPAICVNPASIMGSSNINEQINDQDGTIELDSPPAYTPTHMVASPYVVHADVPSAPASPDSDCMAAAHLVLDTLLKSEDILPNLNASLFAEAPLKSEPVLLSPNTSLFTEAPLVMPEPLHLQYPVFSPASTGALDDTAFHDHASALWKFPLVSANAPQRSPLGRLYQENYPVNGSAGDSPILNAHLGVDIEILREKVERFKRLNPGRELDNTWFLPFVGKLTCRGELLEDYRCYVKNCGQTNKRRDHIVTHVGSHVDHRPFQCRSCGQRFLRKNECKRHESRHSDDFKVFTCQLCPPQETKSYSRQDTLKRHMNKAHGVPLSNKENYARRRGKFEDVGDKRSVRNMAHGWMDGYWP